MAQAASDRAALPCCQVDLHCHILPALDDGAIDLDDSLEMARVAAADDIEVVCATPHIHPDHAVKVKIDDLGGKVVALNEELERRSIPVRIEHGGEVAEPMSRELSDEDLRSVSLGRNGKW